MLSIGALVFSSSDRMVESVETLEEATAALLSALTGCGVEERRQVETVEPVEPVHVAAPALTAVSGSM